MKHLLKIYILIVIIIFGFKVSKADIVEVSPKKTPSNNYPLKLTKGVYRYTVKKNKPIPKIMLGNEAKIKHTSSELKKAYLPIKKSEDFKPLEKLTTISYKASRFISPAINTAQGKLLLTLPDTYEKLSIATPLLDKKLKNTEDIKVNDRQIKLLTENDIKFIKGLIFLELRNMPEIAMAIFTNILMNTDKNNENIIWSLTEAENKLGIYYDKIDQLLSLSQSDTKYGSLATYKLIDEIDSTDYELVEKIDKLVKKYKIDINSINSEKLENFAIAKSQYYMDLNNLNKAYEALNLVDFKRNISKAKLIESLILYKTGKLEDAIQLLSEFQKTINKNDPQKTVINATLARLYFQKSDYANAYQSYLEIAKDHPLWIQTVLEQGWAQVLSKDFEGAAGNMFSLHTDYFKNAYSPDSYLIRSIAYLNLCQYGDGLNSIQSFGQKYVNIKSSLDEFEKSKSDPTHYYELVREQLLNPSASKVQNVPRAFILELAHHPSFLSIQKQINSIEDQDSILIKLSQRLKQIEFENLNISNNNTSKYSQKQKDIARLIYQILVPTQDSITKYRANSQKRLLTLKDTLKADAARALKARFLELNKQLENQLNQAELLQYEIYAGAGEQLQFMIAGGKTADEIRAQLKAQDHKSLKWNFKGEIWEDEIGHYRSSLKNACPNNNQAMNE